MRTLMAVSTIQGNSQLVSSISGEASLGVCVFLMTLQLLNESYGKSMMSESHCSFSIKINAMLVIFDSLFPVEV